MAHTGICPHCKKTLVSVEAEDIDIKGFQVRWEGLSYQCPSCKSVLGVQMNPLTLNQDLKTKLLKEIKRM